MKYITFTFNPQTMVNKPSWTTNRELAYTYPSREAAELAIEYVKAHGLTDIEVLETCQPAQFRLVEHLEGEDDGCQVANEGPGSKCRKPITHRVEEPWTPGRFRTDCCADCAQGFVDNGYHRVCTVCDKYAHEGACEETCVAAA
jgi:hypothetical protein